MRLTKRGEALVVAVLLIAAAAFVIFAGVIGQDWKAERLCEASPTCSR